jgi:nucleoside 2-deoxyribosyltransferase
MHIFLAGIMQGSRQDHLIESQDYRLLITEALQRHVPGVTITDPWAMHPESINYDPETARRVFHSLTAVAAEADVLIAFLPQASMGTAMEMYQAYQAGKHIIAVTTLVHQWAIRFTASEILPDMEALLDYIESGRLASYLTPMHLGPLEDPPHLYTAEEKTPVTLSPTKDRPRL